MIEGVVKHEVRALIADGDAERTCRHLDLLRVAGVPQTAVESSAS
jgi:hypothetical protein